MEHQSIPDDLPWSHAFYTESPYVNCLHICLDSQIVLDCEIPTAVCLYGRITY